MSVRNRERRQAERNLANREMWLAKFEKAMDGYDKSFKGQRNMLVAGETRLPFFVRSKKLIKNGGKP